MRFLLFMFDFSSAFLLREEKVAVSLHKKEV